MQLTICCYTDLSSSDVGSWPRLSSLLPFMTCESWMSAVFKPHRCSLKETMVLAVSGQYESCQHRLVKLHLRTVCAGHMPSVQWIWGSGEGQIVRWQMQKLYMCCMYLYCRSKLPKVGPIGQQWSRIMQKWAHWEKTNKRTPCKYINYNAYESIYPF